jgi:hypothetical protein
MRMPDQFASIHRLRGEHRATAAPDFGIEIAASVGLAGEIGRSRYGTTVADILWEVVHLWLGKLGSRTDVLPEPGVTHA